MSGDEGPQLVSRDVSVLVLVQELKGLHHTWAAIREGQALFSTRNLFSRVKILFSELSRNAR